jgi:site-specific recombinase XerD
LAPLPAEPRTVALYLAAEAARWKTSTLQRHLAAIVIHHRAAGLAFDAHAPDLVDVWRGIRRRKGTAKCGKAPILTEELVSVLGDLPDSLAGKRDRAILALTFAAALRRSETAALDVRDSRSEIVRASRRQQARCPSLPREISRSDLGRQER